MESKTCRRSFLSSLLLFLPMRRAQPRACSRGFGGLRFQFRPEATPLLAIQGQDMTRECLKCGSISRTYSWLYLSVKQPCDCRFTDADPTPRYRIRFWVQVQVTPFVKVRKLLDWERAEYEKFVRNPFSGWIDAGKYRRMFPAAPTEVTIMEKDSIFSEAEQRSMRASAERDGVRVRDWNSEVIGTWEERPGAKRRLDKGTLKSILQAQAAEYGE